jgi:hypothetical protein
MISWFNTGKITTLPIAPVLETSKCFCAVPEIVTCLGSLKKRSSATVFFMRLNMGLNSSTSFTDYYQCHSSVGIALGYRLDDRSFRVRFSAGAGKFSLHHSVQNGSGAHPASYPMDARDSFPWGKAAGAWSWPLTSIWCRGQRMSGAIHLLPQYAFMAWC